MEIIKLLFETIYNVLIFVPKLLLAVFPMYDALSNFNQNLIAAALGVSPFFIFIIVKVVKIILKQLNLSVR